MKLKDYIKDKKLAVATEIYNAQFSSVEDAASLMERIADERKEFEAIIREFNIILYNLKVAMSTLNSNTKRLKKFRAFKDSHMAHLIQTFVENNTEENLDALKKEIEPSNEFGIVIVPEWEYKGRERAYGCSPEAHIKVGYTHTYYLIGKWDFDKDMQNAEQYWTESYDDVQEFLHQKEEMYDKYGFDVLIQIFADFEKIHGPMQADEDWAIRRYRNAELEDDYY